MIDLIDGDGVVDDIERADEFRKPFLAHYCLLTVSSINSSHLPVEGTQKQAKWLDTHLPVEGAQKQAKWLDTHLPVIHK